MKKKYQVFVSSTYEDLIEERKEVSQAILECNCIPSGMELFPASNKKQWEIIKQIIDDSDFYLLIIAGRYGTLGIDDTGRRVGYTEMEFDYARSLNKPILAFINKEPEKLPAKYVEKSERRNKHLQKFIEKVKSNAHIKYWSNKDNLKSSVLYSLNSALEDTDAAGWVKGENEKLSDQIYYVKESELGFEYFDLNNAKYYTHVTFKCLRNQMQYYTERFYWVYGGKMSASPYMDEDVLVDSFSDKNYIAYTNRLPHPKTKDSEGESGFIITVSDTNPLNAMFLSNEPIYNHRETVKLWVKLPDSLVFKKAVLKKYSASSEFVPYDEENLDVKDKKYINIEFKDHEMKGSVFNLSWEVEKVI